MTTPTKEMTLEEQYCPACRGEGVIHTGMSESSTTLCEKCEGSGIAQAHASLPNAAASLAVPARQPKQEQSCLTIETIVRLMDENTDRDFGLIAEPFARAVEREVRASLAAASVPAQQIGGAHLAAELDPATPVYTAEQVATKIQAARDEAQAVPVIIDLGYRKTLRREERGHGFHGWLLHDEDGKLVRGLNAYEQNFVDSTIRAMRSPAATANTDEGNA